MIATLIDVGSARAQQRPSNLPPTALPDVRLPSLPKAPLEQPAPEIPLPESAPSRVPVGAESIRFVLTGLVVTGATVYRQDELSRPFADQIGHEITLGDAYGIAKAIQQRYREDGYFLTRVIVPEQVVRDGAFRVQVIEGFISDVQFEGDVGASQELVDDYFAPVTQERPVRLRTLERALLLANDVPGMRITALLRPSPQDVGGAELVVTRERQSFGGFATLDNFGDDYTGRWEMAAGVNANSFTPWGEEISIIGFASEPYKKNSEKVGQASASWRIGNQGLAFESLVSYGDSNPGNSLDEFDFDSKELLVALVASYPVLRGRDLSIWARAGFEYTNEDTDIFGGQTFSRDRLRVFYIANRIEFRDSLKGSTAGEVQFRQGLPILDATKESDDDKSRADGTGQSSVLRASMSRLQPLVDDFALFGRFAGQYAFDDVLAPEEFDIGGVEFARGYDLSEAAGDNGVGATIEIQYRYRPPITVVDALQPFVFYDYGKVWNRGDGDPSSLSSAGAGIRVAALGSFSVELTVARPLTAQSQRANNTREPQLLFRTLARF